MNNRIALRAAVIAAVVAAVATAVGFAAGAWTGPLLIGACLLPVCLAAAAGWFAFRELESASREIRETASRIVKGEPGGRGEVERRPPTLSSSLRILTARIDAEASDAAAGRARLSAMVEASDGPVLALDGETSLRLANSEALRFFGRSEAEALGKPLIEVCRDHEINDQAQATAGDGQARSATIFFGVKQQPILVTTRSINGGGDWRVLLSLTDLEEFRRLDRVRQDFVANVSHELRTPLASIKAMTETLTAEPSIDAAIAAEFLERISAEVDRLANLTGDLLDLSRIESGALEIHPTRESLKEVLTTAYEAVRHRAETAGVSVEVRSGIDRPVVVDRDIVIRIVTNLLDNAVKFSSRGSRVVVAPELEPNALKIVVADDGPGVPPAELARVFERFFRGDRARQAGGTGLGLAIVKHLAKIHRGSVSAESEEGRGTTFTVHLREFEPPGLDV